MSINIINKKESGAIEEVLNALPIFSDDKADIKKIRAIYVVGEEGSANVQAVYSSYTQGLAYKTVNNGTAVEVKGYTSGLQTAILEGKITSIIIPEYIYSYIKAATTGNGWLPVVGVNIQSEDSDLSEEAKAKITSIVVGDKVEYIKGSQNSSKGAFTFFKNLVEITSPFTGKQKHPEGFAYSSGEWFGDHHYGNSYYQITVPRNWNLTANSPSTAKASYRIPSSLKTVKITADAVQPLAFMQFKIQRAYLDQATSIGAQAFFACRELESVSLSEKLTSIGDRAFNMCEILDGVNLPGTLTSLGAFVFANCSKLSKINIPKGMTTIQEGSFGGCAALKELSFEQGSNLTSIGKGAFYRCSNLIDIEIPNKVTSIGNQAFWYSGLQSAIINNNVKSIEEYAFRNCESLTTVKIESPITFIGDYAFADNPELFILELTGKGQATLGRGVFQNCKKLEEVVIPVGFAKKFSEEIFAGCSKIQKMQIPFVGLEQGTSTQYCFGALFSTDQPSDSNNYYQATQVIIVNNSATQVNYYIPKSLIEVTVCNGSIPPSGFASCTSITRIKLEEGVTDIGAYAFADCSNLTYLNIPHSVKSISNHILALSYKISAINYAGTISQWEAINKDPDWHINSLVKRVHCSNGTVIIK